MGVMKTLSTDEFRGYLKGNIIKYIFKAGYKEDSNKDEAHKAQEDLDKAVWYINKLKKYLIIKRWTLMKSLFFFDLKFFGEKFWIFAMWFIANF